MRIAISGSSGFVGKHLTEFFSAKGDEVIPLPHSLFNKGNAKELLQKLAGCTAVINLAGASINQRWTVAAKQQILNSRIRVTRALVSAINEMPVKPSVFISASAVGIYPDAGIYTENNSSEGQGFLAEVCARWEEEAQRVSTDVRLVITRFGVVLGKDGGALPMMLLPFRFFVGGRMASGEQGFSWIHIEDLVQAMQFVLSHPELSGPINFVSPYPVVNRTFVQEVSEVMHRPAYFPVPAFVFRLLYGEGEVMMTKGQQAYPARLMSAGYTFRYPELRLALRNFLL